MKKIKPEGTAKRRKSSWRMIEIHHWWKSQRRRKVDRNWSRRLFSEGLVSSVPVTPCVCLSVIISFLLSSNCIEYSIVPIYILNLQQTNISLCLGYSVQVMSWHTTAVWDATAMVFSNYIYPPPPRTHLLLLLLFLSISRIQNVKFSVNRPGTCEIRFPYIRLFVFFYLSIPWRSLFNLMPSFHHIPSIHPSNFE